jgi:hypothetical protein
VDVDHWKLVMGVLDAIAVVMDLSELGPIGRWPTRSRHRWWLDGLTDVREDSLDRPRIDDEGDEPYVAAEFADQMQILTTPPPT